MENASCRIVHNNTCITFKKLKKDKQYTGSGSENFFSLSGGKDDRQKLVLAGVWGMDTLATLAGQISVAFIGDMD